MLCMSIETFPVSVIAPDVTIVVYGILFGGIHSTKPIYSIYLIISIFLEVTSHGLQPCIFNPV